MNFIPFSPNEKRVQSTNRISYTILMPASDKMFYISLEQHTDPCHWHLGFFSLPFRPSAGHTKWIIFAIIIYQE